MVAMPGDPGNGIALDSLPAPVQVDIAYGGSCTAGKRDDFDRYHEVLAWGLARGLRVAPGVQLYLQYGTTAVRDYCQARGYDRTFHAMGAREMVLGDFTANLRLIPKLDLQIWANPMPRNLRSAYNAATRMLGNDLDFPRRMASRLRLYNKDADRFDPIGAHPVQLGSPDW